jgi:ADP-ribose pyrophosphatase YjhB (NUDIX family)
MRLDWDFLINYLKDEAAAKVGLCFVVDYHSFVFIARRHKTDYLRGLYELPQGILNPQEGVVEGTTRILRDEYNVILKDITRYLGFFDYVSPNGNKTRMFSFVVTVKDVFQIKIKRNDHGTWLQPSEIKNWLIIDHFLRFLLSFWYGEGFDPNLSRAVIEQAKRENIWRFKVRVLLFRKGQILVLKRARRQKIMPLYYELPGKEIRHNQDIDSAIVSSVTDQTGWPPENIVSLIGFFDYKSEITNQVVREFIYSASAQDKPVKLSEHAYSAWVVDEKDQNLSFTPSTRYAFNCFDERAFVNIPDSLKIPPSVYCSMFEASLTPEYARYLDAMYELEAFGKVDVEALRGKTLIKNSFSPEMQKKLGL